MQPPDREPVRTEVLLAQVRQGSAAAIEQLLALHRSFLRAFVELRMDPALRRRVDPSDVIQEAQIEIARRMPAYAVDSPMPLRLWLRQVTYDRLLMLHRRHARAQRRAMAREIDLPDQSAMVLAEQLASDKSSPSGALVRGEIRQRVQAAVEALSPDDREIVLMRNFEGLGNGEVALLLHITPDAASKRYGRALLRLRTRLRECGLAESNHEIDQGTR